MVELRREHQHQLSALEDKVLGMGSRILDQLDEAIRALGDRDVERAEAVIRADDHIDRTYQEVEKALFDTIALQAPVAGDLRLVSALIHTNLHLERMGDLCVNVAKLTRLMVDYPADEELMAQVREMAVHAKGLLQRCLDAFAARDLELVRTLPGLDDPLDRLNKGLFRRLVDLAARDETRLDWAMRMVLVARYMERIGDHSVDIGEQLAFLITGEYIDLEPSGPLP